MIADDDADDADNDGACLLGRMIAWLID